MTKQEQMTEQELDQVAGGIWTDGVISGVKSDFNSQVGVMLCGFQTFPEPNLSQAVAQNSASVEG